MSCDPNELLLRTKEGKIILFYLLFYAALVGFFAAMLTIFYQTLDDRKPKWLLDRSLIGTNPGLGFRPMPPESNVESTLIWYRASDPKNVNIWKDQLDEFLQPYLKARSPDGTIIPCDKGEPPKGGSNIVCDVVMKDWLPCLSKSAYSFNSSDGGPCIFLKLNKIFGWSPDYYNTSSMPERLPQEIKDRITKAEQIGGTTTKDLKVVWVTCEGENPADVENIGPLHFYPDLGFDGQYFPFENVKDYLSPLVAVHFQKPARGVLINIECKAWANNIVHDRHERRGSVHFELMVDY